jgi:hypothetical protein
LVSDGSGKVATNAVTSTELGYLSGVTSAIQTQINGKQATITGGATTIVSSDLTASRVLVSDTNGKVATNNVTTTELGYLSGVTSAIQTQLNAKQGTITLNTNGTSGQATLIGNTLNIPQYSGGSGVAKSFLNVLVGATINASTTTYATFGGSNFSTEFTRMFMVPQNCTVSRLYVRITTNQVAGSTSTIVFTLRKNSTATELTCTIAGGSSGGTFASNLTNSVSFAAGDLMSIKAVNNALASSGSVGNISIMVEA